MFAVPSTEIPVAITEASALLQKANQLFDHIREYQREQFRSFWFENGQLKPKEHINAVLDAMDSASPGQSLRFFAAAKELAELILSMSPEALGNDDWYPQYPYSVVNGSSVRLD